MDLEKTHSQTELLDYIEEFEIIAIFFKFLSISNFIENYEHQNNLHDN